MATLVTEVPATVRKLREVMSEKSEQRELASRKLDVFLASQSAADAGLDVAVKARAAAQAALESLAYESTQANDPLTRSLYDRDRSPENLARLVKSNVLLQASKERRSAAFAAIADAESQVQWMTLMIDAWKKVVAPAKAELSAAERARDEARSLYNDAYAAWRAADRALSQKSSEPVSPAT